MFDPNGSINTHPQVNKWETGCRSRGRRDDRGHTQKTRRMDGVLNGVLLVLPSNHAHYRLNVLSDTQQLGDF